MDVKDICTNLVPVFNHLILKLVKVDFEHGLLHVPEGKEPVAPIMKVIAVGPGCVKDDAEPCPKEIEEGAYVLVKNGAVEPMLDGYYTAPWVAVLGWFPKEFVEPELKSDSNLVLPKGKLITVVN